MMICMQEPEGKSGTKKNTRVLDWNSSTEKLNVHTAGRAIWKTEDVPKVGCLMSEEITETIGTSVWRLSGVINIQVTFHGPRMSHTLSIRTDKEDKGIEAVSWNKKCAPKGWHRRLRRKA